jgi:hypothetical protein
MTSSYKIVNSYLMFLLLFNINLSAQVNRAEWIGRPLSLTEILSNVSNEMSVNNLRLLRL